MSKRLLIRSAPTLLVLSLLGCSGAQETAPEAKMVAEMPRPTRLRSARRRCVMAPARPQAGPSPAMPPRSCGCGCNCALAARPRNTVRLSPDRDRRRRRQCMAANVCHTSITLNQAPGRPSHSASCFNCGIFSRGAFNCATHRSRRLPPTGSASNSISPLAIQLPRWTHSRLGRSSCAGRKSLRADEARF